jgi:peptidoglycan/LPS O-acetylase OafA/YrhL
LESASTTSRQAVAAASLPWGGGVALLAINYHAWWYIGRGPRAATAACLVILNFLLFTFGALGLLRISGRAKKVDKAAGDITYPLYLNQYAISVAWLTLWPDARPGLLHFLGCLGACVAASCALILLSEPFTRRLRDRIRGVRL